MTGPGDEYRASTWFQDTFGLTRGMEFEVLAIVDNEDIAAWNQENYPDGYNPGLERS